MLTKRLALAVLAAGVLGGATALAQDPGWQDPPPPKKTLAERLDGFGKALFGPVMPPDQPDRNTQPPSKPTRGYLFPRNAPAAVPPRSGNAQRTNSQSATEAQNPSDPPVGADVDGNPSLQTARRVRPATARSAPSAAEPAPTQTLAPVKTGPAVPRTATESTSVPSVTAADDPVALSPPNPTTIPLHERLKNVRHSPFDEPASAPEQGSSSASDSTASTRPEGPATGQPRTGAISGVQEGVRPSPTPAVRSPGLSPQPLGAASPGVPTPARRPSAFGEPAGPPPQTNINGMPLAVPPARLTLNGQAKQESENVLLDRKGPVLSVETVGPHRISVGKEAAYELTIQNAGEVAADQVVVLVTLPEWADVASADATMGSAQAAPPGSPRAPFQWNVGRLEAKSREKLVLRIVPRQNRPFDLDISWDSKPVASHATIEVQEPKLMMRLEGPRDVLFGRREVYRLKLTNSGNGPAENVTVAFTPVGAGDNQPSSHRLGILPPGDEKTLEMELTARQAGSVTLQVEARGDGGARAVLSEKVLVRRAGLQVDLDGPSVQYVGTAAAYRIRVRNPGNAPARNLRLSANLPAGTKFLSGTEGAKLAANGGKVQWDIDNLEPGAERGLLLKCSFGRPGPSRVEVVSTADDELAVTAEALTRVEAMADLRLEVKDPAGPIAVGEETTYELVIRNRGTKSAQDVAVSVFFSNGLEATAAEGGAHRLHPGQVVFQKIPSIAAGTDLTLKVRARAQKPGTHLFRAEVLCEPLGARLVREETTHFYQDTPAAQQASGIIPEKAAAPLRREPRGTNQDVPRPLPALQQGGQPMPGASQPFQPPPGPAAPIGQPMTARPVEEQPALLPAM
jgi:uncharacterized repeat protein (TIGR01451 family)